MARHKLLSKAINETHRTLAKYDAIIKSFPDAKIHETYYPHTFSSKEVNQNYSKLKFESKHNRLIVMPYSEVDFEFEGKIETVIINSSPKANRLAYVSWEKYPSKEKIIKFSRLTFNLKNNNFKDDMMNDCRIAIMNFIKDYPNYKLDDKHLEPRLKKLILFT